MSRVQEGLWDRTDVFHQIHLMDEKTEHTCLLRMISSWIHYNDFTVIVLVFGFVIRSAIYDLAYTSRVQTEWH